MDLGLKGKVALVAAASRGLGRAVAEELAREGSSLILCSRGADALDAAAESICKKYEVPVVAVAADLSTSTFSARRVRTGLIKPTII